MNVGNHAHQFLAASVLARGHIPVESLILAVAIIGFIVYRQVVPRRLSGRSLALIPLVVLYFLWRSLTGFHPGTTHLLDIGITSVVSLVLGLLAARQLRVYPPPTTGKATASGSWTYFLWWVAAFAIKGGLAVAFGETSIAGTSQADILIPVFLLVATRNLYLYRKARQLGLALH